MPEFLVYVISKIYKYKVIFGIVEHQPDTDDIINVHEDYSYDNCDVDQNRTIDICV